MQMTVETATDDRAALLSKRGERLVVAYFDGVLNESVVWATWGQLLAISAVNARYDLILDFSEAIEIDINAEFVYRFADNVNETSRRNGKTAWVIGDHEMRRTFANFVVAVLSVSSRGPHRVFNGRCEAEQWLRAI